MRMCIPAIDEIARRGLEVRLQEAEMGRGEGWVDGGARRRMGDGGDDAEDDGGGGIPPLPTQKFLIHRGRKFGAKFGNRAGLILK